MITTSRCKELKESFDNFYRTRLQTEIDDSRDRVNMILKDEVDRKVRGLSALASTKSTSIVDGFVESAFQAYTQDPDSITFTPRNLGNKQAEDACSLLTQNFIYRADTTGDFKLWLESQLRAGATDGVMASMVSWVTETYTEDVPTYLQLNPDGSQVEIDEQTYTANQPYFPDNFVSTTTPKETITRDTWQIDQLMLGRDCGYDPKIRKMNVERGQFAYVILQKSVDDIVAYQKTGLFKPMEREEIEKHQKTGEPFNVTTFFQDKKDHIDLQDNNLVDLCIFFYKENGCWKVQYSLDWKEELTDWLKVNDVFFGGKNVNRLPLVIGYGQSTLWEAVGKSMPAKIAPIEDELTDHRNNASDIAKQIAQGGRIRVAPDADVNIDQIMNSRIFRAKAEEVEFTQYNPGLLEAMRLNDAREQDIAALVPVNSADRSRQLATKGTTKTLGLSQMLENDSNAKQGVYIVMINSSFMQPILSLIANLTIAYETDSQVMEMSAQKAGIQLPMVAGVIDWSFLDIPFDVQINAGMGSVPRQKRVGLLQEMASFRQAFGVPTDFNDIAAQISSAVGFTTDSFFPKEAPPPPPPPQVEYKATLNIDLGTLMMTNPQEANQLIGKLLSGDMSITGAVKDNVQIQMKEMQGQMMPETGEGVQQQERMDIQAEGMGQMMPEGMMSGQDY